MHISLLFSHELGLSCGSSSWRLKVITVKDTLIFSSSKIVNNYSLIHSYRNEMNENWNIVGTGCLWCYNYYYLYIFFFCFMVAPLIKMFDSIKKENFVLFYLLLFSWLVCYDCDCDCVWKRREGFSSMYVKMWSVKWKF
jgi:hypothetical protein